jgi:pimeloyl-ACP methyl ester carboxylesterase
LSELLQIRIHGGSEQTTLIYLPGLHGDWTLLGPFRAALSKRARLVQVTYPRRTDWTLVDFASAIQERLCENGITEGWLIGESFSSQVAWTLVGSSQSPDRTRCFRPHGLILAGGFVRHPWPWGVHLAHVSSKAVPMWFLRHLCSAYTKVAARKHCGSPEVLADLKEFVVRRTEAGDREAINRRYELIAGSNLRGIAQSTHLPVFLLTGAFDPIVPWWHVRPWLQKNCPGYRGSRIFWRGGHNILLSNPQKSADQILEWILGPDQKAQG